MTETPRSDEERGADVQPGEPLRSTDEEREGEDLAAQGESAEEEDETEIEGEETDEDEDTRE